MNDLSGLWEPLGQANNEIRLLLLKPSAVKDALLEGRLENKSLNQPLHFDAISYAWGGAQASIPLVLETHDGDIEIPLTEHVGSALRLLRQSTVTTALWIDAICVSQRDTGEREQQIGMLHYIFNRAVKVHAWLGNSPTNPSDTASVRPVPATPSTSAFIRNPLAPPSQRTARQSIDELKLASHSTYWNRLWVVGEIVLARDLVLHYGQKSFDVRLMMEDIEQNRSEFSEQSLPRYLKDLFDLRTVLPLSVGLSSDEKAGLLLAVMNRARPRQAGDPRDRVHAFIGLYNSLFNDDMRADYSANLTTVYTAFAKRLIRATNSLRILSQANAHHAVTPNLPSWVPDWASMYDHAAESSDAAWWDAFSPLWNAWPVSFEDHINGHSSLNIKGEVFTAVDATADVLEGCASRASAWATLANWKQFFKSHDHSSQRTWVYTLLRGTTFGQEDPDRFSIVPAARRRISQVHLTESQKDRFPDGFEGLSNKRLFVTESGRLGIGPRHMLEGDHLAFLAGAKVPFLLRLYTGSAMAEDVPEPYMDLETPLSEIVDYSESEASSETSSAVYHVVGPCFLAGYMNHTTSSNPHAPSIQDLKLI